MFNPYYNISYNKYKTIEKTSFALFYISLVMNYFITKNNLAVTNSILSYTLLTNYLYMIGSGNINFTKEINDIDSLYQEYIKNYLKLNKELSLDNPIDMSVLYYTLLNRGYLSANKNFYSYWKDTVEYNRILGSNIINGAGVCRHKASFLKDILKAAGYDAYLLTVHMNNYEITYESSDSKKYDELQDWIIDNIYSDKLYEEALELIQSRQDIQFINKINKEDFFTKIIANHAITYVNDKHINYFIDPTQGTIYNLHKENNILYDDAIYAKIKPLASKLIGNSLADIKNIKNCIIKNRHLDLTTNPFDKSCMLFDDNKELIDEFYQDNNDLVNEINFAINSFKKRNLKL